jgi:hypothetical protein
MSHRGTRTVSEAALRILTEDELAAWYRGEGVRLKKRRGRWWEEVWPGYYRAIHWMARQRRCEIERPAVFCWAFRTTLPDEDADQANGRLPVHLLTALENYDLEMLPSKLRNKLRKSRRINEIVQVTEPTLLRDQGYEVRCSVTERRGIWKLPSKESYVAGLDDYVGNPGRLVLAGLTNGRLSGYLDAFAVGGTAYIDHVYVHSDALSTEVGTGLVFELVQACRRSGSIREVVYGIDLPSEASLKHYKTKMGFPVVMIPQFFWLLQPAGALMCRWRPEAHYRLTGAGRYAVHP